jgi:RecB family endonuclease NucS
LRLSGGKEGKVPGLKLFHIGAGNAVEIAARAAVRERHLQDLVEANMESLLGVRFLASEYNTGPQHGGRTDSLGIDENGSPVVVEFKAGRDAGVVNQGLFYLSWLTDHRAEFQLLVRATPSHIWRFPAIVGGCPVTIDLVL